MSQTVIVRNPGLLSLIVDLGRPGFSDIGVPSSSALDRYACRALYCLLGFPDAPVLEVMGPRFALQFDADMVCAITGARVRAFLDDAPLRPWTSFRAAKGSTLRIKEITEGFRYYIGFAGRIAAQKVMGSFATNMECRFGGLNGIPLKGGDILEIAGIEDRKAQFIPERMIPAMSSPHMLRALAGPEFESFTPESGRYFWEPGNHELYTVSRNLNRTGIRLEGKPLAFFSETPRSIISEGILPGTVQIPGDGQPIIMLHERTIGGYARAAVIARADLDRLAHLKAGDMLFFEKITIETAELLWRGKKSLLDQFPALCK